MNRVHQHGFVAALTIAFVSTLAMPTPALSYKRTETCDSFGTYACKQDESPKPLYWGTDCVGYQLNDEGSDDFESDRRDQLLEGLVELSFGAWNDPSCSRLQLVNRGRTSVSKAAYDIDAGPANNTNAVIWRDDEWPHNPSAFALTSVTYSSKTGQIVDADIELNGEHFTFGNLNKAHGAGPTVDVRNVLTHEAGHFVGLDHPDDKPMATMWGEASVGEIAKRTLARDDVEGVCAAYPANESATTCSSPEDFVPKIDPFQSKQQKNGPVCALIGSSGGPAIPAAVVLMVFMLGTLRLTRKNGATSA